MKAFLAVFAMTASTTSYGFVATPASLPSSSFAFSPHKGLPAPSTERRGRNGISTVLRMAAPPLIENWYILSEGGVIGIVKNHPTLPDGTEITTSPLTDPRSSKNNKVVQTLTGSSYKLGRCATPLIEDWYMGDDGEIRGVVSNHPTLRDGTPITTSPLQQPRSAQDNKVVQTISGSSYQLGRRAASAQPQAAKPGLLPNWFNAGAAGQSAGRQGSVNARQGGSANVRQGGSVNVRQGSINVRQGGSANVRRGSANVRQGGSANVRAAEQDTAAKPGWFGARGGSQPAAARQGSANVRREETSPAAQPSWFGFGRADQSRDVKESSASVSRSAEQRTAAKPNWFNARKAGPSTTARQSPANARAAGQAVAAAMGPATKDVPLNGMSVGEGRYLLAGKAFRSTSGRSDIYSAYRSDSKGRPTGARLTVKISADFDRLAKESSNYDKVTGGLFSGSFVKKIEYLPSAGGMGVQGSVLVLESGERNLRELMEARGKQGLEGKSLRQAAVALVECIQAMHSSNLVWTDLKAENFVVVTDSMGDGNLQGVKGIDLESVVQKGAAPLDYSPEACPPEFADAFLNGQGESFRVEENYDIWSFGMLMYELSTGRKYFLGQSPTVVTRILRSGFVPDLSAVPDDRLKDLIAQCLRLEPRKRPGIAAILFHPYFLTTGFASISV